jgi:hypothetical protein
MPTQGKGIDFTGNSVKLNRFTALDLEAKKNARSASKSERFYQSGQMFWPAVF